MPKENCIEPRGLRRGKQTCGYREPGRELQSCKTRIRGSGPPTAPMRKLSPGGGWKSQGVRQSLKLLLYPWPAFQTRAGRASREGRGLLFSRSCTRPSDAYLAALLLHFPRRADVTSLQQMMVDEGKQLPPLPGLGHARDPASLFTCTPPRPPPASSLAP